LVETVFPLELPRPVAFETTTCQNTCDVGGNVDGGSSTGMIAGAIVGVALLAAIGAYFYRRRRRANSVPAEVNMEEPMKNKVETKSKGAFWNNQKGSSDDETHPQDLAADQSFVDDQDLERGAPPNTQRPPVAVVSTHPVAVVSTRNLMEEADEEMTELELKAEKLRAKREAIENWHNDKKKGSNRSLDTYMSEEENLDDEEKERRRAERRARREAKRASIREQERAEQSAETPVPPPVRRSSSRSIEDPDGGEKMRRSSSKSKLERKSSRSKLSDTDDRKERSSNHKEERGTSSRKKERSSSRSRLNDP
jgi:LPXTG-motif cell wall-anchored protein